MEYRPQVDSKSTDKLALLAEAAKHLPSNVLDKLESFELSWHVVDEVVVPFIKAKFR